jgi:hypothetical protein
MDGTRAWSPLGCRARRDTWRPRRPRARRRPMVSCKCHAPYRYPGSADPGRPWRDTWRRRRPPRPTAAHGFSQMSRPVPLSRKRGPRAAPARHLAALARHLAAPSRHLRRPRAGSRPGFPRQCVAGGAGARIAAPDLGARSGPGRPAPGPILVSGTRASIGEESGHLGEVGRRPGSDEQDRGDPPAPGRPPGTRAGFGRLAGGSPAAHRRGSAGTLALAQSAEPGARSDAAGRGPAAERAPATGRGPAAERAPATERADDAERARVMTAIDTRPPFR